MSHPLRRALVFLAAGALALSLSADTGRRRAAGPTTGAPSPQKPFIATDLEYYLTDDGVAYIRPGLNIKVESITIGSDRRPVVELKDAQGGLLVMLKLSVAPSGSDAAGVKP